MWPLLALAVDRQLEGKQETAKLLASSISAPQELAVNDMVYNAIHRFAKSATEEEWAEFILNHRLGTEIANPPELNTIAQNLGITAIDLVYAYVSYWIADKTTYTSKEVQHIFSEIEKAIENQREKQVHIHLVTDAKWVMDEGTVDRGKRLLKILVDRLPQQPSAINLLVGLYIKLLATDADAVRLVLPLYNALSQLNKSVFDEVPSWWIADHIVDVPLRQLTELCKLTGGEERVPDQGFLAFWEIIINAILAPHRYHAQGASKWKKLKSLRLDWRLGMSCVDHADVTVRRWGITVITLSDFPIRALC